jgi:hypothetical protein
MDVSERERLNTGQVTDFLEATEICLALLQHELETAPEGEDEELEEIADNIFAVRLAQDVYNELFPRADTTPAERARLRDCVVAAGAGYSPFIQEVLADIGSTIMESDYRFLPLWLHC